MSTIRCYELNCDYEAELSCNCTQPETYSCKKHVMKHFKFNKNLHNLNSIFVEPIEGTKEAILNFLIQEKNKADAIKAKLVSSFTQTLYNLENAFREIIKEVDIENNKISSYFDKFWQTTKILRNNKDSALSLLGLQPYEAAEKAKDILSIRSNNIELFNEIGSKIDKTIKRFKKENSKLIQQKELIELEIPIDNKMKFEGEKKETSLNRLKEVIKTDPNNSDAYNAIGDIFYKEKRHEEAIKYFNDAIRINPKKAIYYINYGNALNNLNREEEAMKFYKRAISIEPNSADAYNSIGIILENEKRYEEALENYENAISINPKAIYYINKGNALNNLNRKEEAIECYQKVITFDPNNADAYIGIGNIFLSESRYEEALMYYNKAISINPNNKIIYINKEAALRNLGRIDEADECIKKQISL